VLALLGTAVLAFGPNPEGLSLRGQYALSTMFFAGALWVTGAFPLAVTALSIPALLTAFGVYPDLDTALVGFADHLIFLFIAGFMLANALQKYDIDRRIALWILSVMGTSPRRLVLSVMVATAFLSMWVSNTATTAMMTPIAVGVLAQVIGKEDVVEAATNVDDVDADVSTDGGIAVDDGFRNIQVAMLLGTAYAASVGGVGTLIGTPPNAVLASQLNEMLGYEVGFA
jgi:sodium-dependent dicarboxylate transporter 2/3/5